MAAVTVETNAWAATVASFIAGCNFLLESATIVGLRLTTALNAALLSRVDIVFAIAIGATFFSERPRKADLWGIALLTSGSLAVLNVHLGSISTHVIGDLLIVGAGLLIAFNAFVSASNSRVWKTE